MREFPAGQDPFLRDKKKAGSERQAFIALTICNL
jgi:hypothetical protein